MSGGQRAAPLPAPGGGGGGANVKAVRAQLDLAEQDCTRVSVPDFSTPFSSLEDAVDRLLPYHVYGAEDALQADVREVAAQAAPSSLATSRQEAWQDFLMQKAGELGTGLIMLEKKVHKAEQEALLRSQLPQLMLQSYATAEAQALMVGEQQRPQLVAMERERAERERLAEAQRQAELQHQAELERQAAAAAAQQQALLAAQQLQQQQQEMVRKQQMLLAVQQQQQQQARAAAAAGAQQHPGGPMQQPGGMPGQMPGQRPVGPPMAQQPAKPMSAAEAKAKQLAALAARVSQRK